MKVLQKFAASAFTASLIGLSGSAQAVPLNVLNPSFENFAFTSGNSTTDGTGTYNVSTFPGPDTNAIPDWRITANTSIFAGTYAPASGIYTSPIPDGTKVAYLSSAQISQILPDLIASNTTYTLGVFVGQRTDIPISTSYSVNLFAFDGTTATVLATGTPLIDPTPGTFTPFSISYTSPTVLGGLATQNIGIALVSSSSNQVNFDVVTLDATPVPYEFETAAGVFAFGAYVATKRILKAKNKKKLDA